jgi:methylmalonyl-CoA mutase cobalamin-binding subunit
VLYLGANVPLDETARVVRERRPALLCTSLVVARAGCECAGLVQELRGMAPRETAVVVGGAGLAPDTRPIPGVRFAQRVAEMFSTN